MTLREIDPEWYAVVDLQDGSEIAGAVAADEDTGEVHYLEPGYQGGRIGSGSGGAKVVGRVYHNGVKIVRRRTSKRLNKDVYQKG